MFLKTDTSALTTNKKIIFFGDSFIANRLATKSKPHQQYQECDPGSPINYIDIVYTTKNLDLLHFGYAGTSWWYQRCKMIEYFAYRPKELDSVDVIVMCHTNSDRINNSTKAVQFSEEFFKDNELKKYFAHVNDPKFNQWVHLSFIKEIKEKFSDKRIINFVCFNEELSWMKNILPGMICDTPLLAVSMAEFDCNGDPVKGRKLIHARDNEDKTKARNNHFNEKNNQAMANIILQAIDNYTPGIFKLDLSQFDIVDSKVINNYR
jgi:hypothetical protein